MSLIRYQPWGLMRSLQEDIDRLFENRFPGDETVASTASWAPAVDIREDENSFVIHADIPGVAPEDIEVTMEKGVLTISGSRQTSDRTEKEGYRRVERGGPVLPPVHASRHGRLRVDHRQEPERGAGGYHPEAGQGDAAEDQRRGQLTLRPFQAFRHLSNAAGGTFRPPHLSTCGRPGQPPAGPPLSNPRQP